MQALVEDMKSRYHVAISPDYVERLQQSQMHVGTEELYRRILCENLREVADVGTLPYGIASQTSSSLPHTVLLQVNSSRDATQPLRPCADASGEISMIATSPNASHHRLLYLILSDGHTEIPALELSTLSALHGVPIPGEKLLIKAGAEVRNGCIILSNDNVVALGGEVTQLKQEYLARRRRIAAYGAAAATTSLDGAPRFEPLQLGSRYRAGNDNGRDYDGAPRPEGGVRGGGHPGRGTAGHHRNHTNPPNSRDLHNSVSNSSNTNYGREQGGAMRESESHGRGGRGQGRGHRHGRGYGGESGHQSGRGRGRGGMRGSGDSSFHNRARCHSGNAPCDGCVANHRVDDHDRLPAFNAANFPPLR